MNRHYIGVMGLLILGVAAMPASALQEERRDAPYVAFDLRPNMDGGLGVRYYDSVPNGGWPEEFKKEYLLLRKVSLGKSAATIVSTQESAVSNSYYIGVFEVTRYQYALVMGEQPNSVDNPIHPIDPVSWQQLRSVPDEGYVESNDWPLWREVDESSFFGRLRKNLSIDSFDLPTEFQWSYACSYGMTEKAVGIDAEGNEVKGVFQRLFEEEYARLVNEELNLWEEDYTAYLRRFTPQEVHQGYFSIDKKTNRLTDGKIDRKSGLSDDIGAYDLILKNKERLLSFEEPTRFIFSHSALREGWDNPNVFQICTLRHSNSTTAKRQEVGRGLRLCVDQQGTRMDAELLGEEVHDVNKLTVIANESYADFTKALQRETQEVLRERAAKVTLNYFMGKPIQVGGKAHLLSETEASRILIYLEDNGYIDSNHQLTATYREAVANGGVIPLPKPLQPLAEGVRRLINAIYDPKVLEEMVVEEKTTTSDNRLNENFSRAEFQALWREINHQYVYTVNYDSRELIRKAIRQINAELKVKRLRYVMVEGTQDARQVTDFGDTHSLSRTLTDVCTSSVKYDLVGDLAKGANLTRRSIVAILQGIQESTLYQFKNNPEEFIRQAIRIIREQKSTMIVEAIHYQTTEGTYDSSIFTVKSKMDFDRAYAAQKHITDYVFSDSQGERQFAHDLDEAKEVVVYAKLPRSFQIPTPVGNYAPDWAIAMQQAGVKHIFFIAETKGTMDSMDITQIERAKIDCARKLFNSISTAQVRYHQVANYQDLLDCMNMS